MSSKGFLKGGRLNPFTGGKLDPMDIRTLPPAFGHMVLYLVVGLMVLAVSLAIQRSFAELVDQLLPERGWRRVAMHWGYTIAMAGILISLARALSLKDVARAAAIKKQEVVDDAKEAVEIAADVASARAGLPPVFRPPTNKSTSTKGTPPDSLGMAPIGAVPIASGHAMQPQRTIRMAPMNPPPVPRPMPRTGAAMGSKPQAYAL